jgi:hypothetical protein
MHVLEYRLNFGFSDIGAAALNEREGFAIPEKAELSFGAAALRGTCKSDLAVETRDIAPGGIRPTVEG